MDIRSALKSQYHGALKTLEEVIEKCPEAMWNDPADGAARFWRVAYHTLFYTHFYLHQDQALFPHGRGNATKFSIFPVFPRKPKVRPRPVSPTRATNFSNTATSAMA